MHSRFHGKLVSVNETFFFRVFVLLLFSSSSLPSSTSVLCRFVLFRFVLLVIRRKQQDQISIRLCLALPFNLLVWLFICHAGFAGSFGRFLFALL